MSFAEEVLIPSMKMDTIENGFNGDDSEAILYLVCILLLLTVVYSFVINILFGHQTYWRSIEEWIPKRVLSIIGQRIALFSSKFQRESSQLSFRRRKPKGHSPPGMLNRKMTLIDINSHVLVYMCTFLSPADIVTCTNVCKRLLTISETNYLWLEKWKEIVSRNCLNLRNLSPSSDFSTYLGDRHIDMKGKMKFFYSCRQLYRSILQEGVPKLIEVTEENTSDNGDIWPSTCPVIVYGDIYELRGFLRSHPGGAAILLEWRGEDGSRVFHLAAHSKYAMIQMKQYLVWSQKDMIGKKGWPEFAL